MTEAEMRDLIHQYDSLNARRAADEDHDDDTARRLSHRGSRKRSRQEV